MKPSETRCQLSGRSSYNIRLTNDKVSQLYLKSFETKYFVAFGEKKAKLQQTETKGESDEQKS